MIIPFPITFSINFAVGVKYVVAEFQLAAGDDSQEIITQFIQKENIPIYLENNIISTVESFLIDAIQREQDEEDEKCVLEGDIFIKQAKKWSHALVDTNLKWNLLNHPNLATPRSERSDSQSYIGFIPAYQWIVSKPSGLNTLLKLEQSYASAVIMLSQSKETALENMRTRLSTEMDSAVKTTDPELIPELVAKHVQEMDLAQKKWNKEIKGLKSRQKKEYQDFVKEYYQSEYLLSTVNESLRSSSDSSIPDPSISSSSSSSSFSSFSSISSTINTTPANQTTSESSSSSPSISNSASKFIPIPTKKFFSTLTQFGKAKSESTNEHSENTPPTSSGIFPPVSSSPTPSSSGGSSSFSNLPSSPVPSPLYNNDPLYFLNKEAREISKKLYFHETIPVYLGRQRKNLFYFKLFSGDSIEFCAPKEILQAENREEGKEDEEDGEKEKGSKWKQRTKMATSLYGNSLSGIVLLVSPDLAYNSDTCREFVNICGSSTDFHFETFKDQLAKVKGANTRLNSGDFFITKHSNLLHVNVVFHLVVDNADASLNPDTSTFSTTSNAALGLRNIVLTASQCDVSTLVIPAGLSVKGNEATTEALLRRIDIVSKTVKLALTSIGDGGSLKTIQFIVREAPHSSDQPLYKKLKSLLTTSNKTQQPAYKI